MNETSPTKGGMWLKVVRLLVFATTLAVALPALAAGDALALFVFGVMLPLPWYIALWLLRSVAQVDSLRSGLVLSRTLGVVGTLFAAAEVYREVAVSWPTHAELLAFLSVCIVTQSALVIGTSILRRRLDTSGATPAKRDRALAAMGHSLLVLSIIAFLALPFRTGSGLQSREHSAISRLRSMSSAQAAFTGANGGLYAPVECLATPSQCLVNYSAASPVFLTPDLVNPENRGYRFTFHPGARPTAEELKTAGAVPTSVKTWAYAAIPVAPGTSGVRSFCIDQDGILRQTVDDTTPAIVEGRCPETMRPLQ